MTTTRSIESDDLDDFESALLADLRAVVTDRRPARRRTRVLTLGGMAASAAAVVGAGLAVGGSSPAFAVHHQADGDVVVTINRLDDSAGLERALAAQGVTADVDYAHPVLMKTADGKTVNVVPFATHKGKVSGSKVGAVPRIVIQRGSAEGERPLNCSFGKGGFVALDAKGGAYVLTIPRESVLADTPLKIVTATSEGHGTLAVSYYDGQCIEIAAPSK